MPTKKKQVYLEVIRIVSILFVIFNHQSEFKLYESREPTSPLFWVYLFFTVACKIAVPCFFMISGALLLNREPESFKTILLKRVLKYLILLIVISVLYYVQYILLVSEQFSIVKLVAYIFATNISGQRIFMWYLYSYIAFLLSLPFLQSMVKGVKNIMFECLIILQIALSFLNLIVRFCFNGAITPNTEFFPNWMLTNIVVYPLIGYYLQHRFIITKKRFIVSFIVGIVGILLTEVCVYYNHIITLSWDEGLFSKFILPIAAAFYIVTKALFNKVKLSEKTEKVICSVGSNVFGVYLFHIFYQLTPIHTLICDFLSGTIPQIFVCMIWIIVDFVLSYITIFILKKIPIVKKLF